MTRSPITTHVLDTSTGRPAARVPVLLEKKQPTGEWVRIAQEKTDEDGRLMHWLPEGFVADRGFYRLLFDTASYYSYNDQHGFYPYVQIAFEIREVGAHYHVPLLLSPYGYSTYRGS
ncbi:MAG TPA: hydroxyisourate hydrolase [Kiritimatiellia bacterium]|nr:hydroxyisourate hydrolase [Kiritimatiellia bacterium]